MKTKNISIERSKNKIIPSKETYSFIKFGGVSTVDEFAKFLRI